jgi:hypothetical protein
VNEIEQPLIYPPVSERLALSLSECRRRSRRRCDGADLRLCLRPPRRYASRAPVAGALSGRSAISATRDRCGLHVTRRPAPGWPAPAACSSPRVGELELRRTRPADTALRQSRTPGRLLNRCRHGFPRRPRASSSAHARRVSRPASSCVCCRRARLFVDVGSASRLVALLTATGQDRHLHARPDSSSWCESRRSESSRPGTQHGYSSS